LPDGPATDLYAAGSPDEDDSRHDVGYRRELVGDDDHRRPALDEPGEHVGQDPLVGDVDPRRRLVHDEHLGLCCEGACDEHPTLLAARERGDVRSGPVSEPDGVEGLDDDGLVLHRRSSPRSPPPAVGQTPDLHDLLDRGVDRRSQRVSLRDVADPRPLGEVVEVRAEQAHAALEQGHEAQDAAHEGGLA
jgi:hypothetical protein